MIGTGQSTNRVHLQVVHLDALNVAASIGVGTILGISVAVPSYYYAMTSGHGLGLWSMMKARPSRQDAPFQKVGLALQHCLLATTAARYKCQCCRLLHSCTTLPASYCFLQANNSTEHGHVTGRISRKHTGYICPMHRVR